ncbi:MAG: CaiB/BaiF CoA transferase family protein [Candidatus Eiseniibacteriota bacterium]
MPMPSAAPLAHLRVIDLTRVRAGPTAVRQLADWGAEVIKVELPEDAAMDKTRHGSDFQNLQRNKRSLSLNLKSEEGRAVFRRLIERADVLVENYRPDVKDRLGIAYDDLKQINPRLIYASISGYGQTGPYRARPGVDQIAQGMGGLMAITGHEGQGPVRAGIAIADMGAGLYCAIGILTALVERERSGEGQWIQTSLLQAQIALLDFQAARWLVEGEVAGQAGNDHPTVCPTGMFPTSDGYINIAPFGEAQWRKLCAALGIEEALADKRFHDGPSRARNREALNALIAAATRARTSDYWIGVLNEAGIPSGPIYKMDQVFADPQVKHIGIAQSVAHPTLGEMTLVGQPIVMSRSQSALKSAAPERGEHNVEILRELGFDAEEIDAMKRRGTI